MNALSPLALLLGRVLISFMFIMAGLQKVFSIEGTQGYMEMMGVPGVLIYPTILLEVLGGLAVLLGYRTRVASLLLIGFTVLSGLLFHFDPSDQAQMTSLMKNFTIAGGFLFLTVVGPGRFSIEEHRS